ncbi:hypothetical protein [Streptomyces sp. NPDC093984]
MARVPLLPQAVQAQVGTHAFHPASPPVGRPPRAAHLAPRTDVNPQL